MRKITEIVAIICCFIAQSVLPCRGEVVVLKSGAKISGDIVFQNEQVIVIRDGSGARFQYLRSDVESVVSEDTTAVEEASVEDVRTKRVRVGLSAGGGATWLAGAGSGGAACVDIAIGTANLFGRAIFIGGAFGYHGMFFGSENNNALSGTYSFLPIQLRGEIPLTQTAHAPLLAMGVGYGIAVTKNTIGGLFANLCLAWQYTSKKQRTVGLGLYGEIQNARFSMTEHVDGTPYSGVGSHSFVTFGARLAVGL
ncbi:MAG: hypothetical protein IJS13_04275 [Paludibacteraceae bacterium]|nr:hypothetical protein [Paludibacteraceae bacterium]